MSSNAKEFIANVPSDIRRRWPQPCVFDPTQTSFVELRLFVDGVHRGLYTPLDPPRALMAGAEAGATVGAMARIEAAVGAVRSENARKQGARTTAVGAIPALSTRP